MLNLEINELAEKISRYPNVAGDPKTQIKSLAEGLAALARRNIELEKKVSDL